MSCALQVQSLRQQLAAVNTERNQLLSAHELPTVTLDGRQVANNLPRYRQPFPRSLSTQSTKSEAIQNLFVEIDRLGQESNHLKQQLHCKAVECDDLLQLLDDSETKLLTLQVENKELQSDLLRLENENYSLSKGQNITGNYSNSVWNKKLVSDLESKLSVLQQQLDHVMKERDQVNREKSHTAKEKDRLIREMEKMSKEKCQLIDERDKISKEKDQVISQRDLMTRGKDQVIKERDQLIRERDQVIKDKGQAINERNQLVKERDQVISERDHVSKGREQLMIERDQLIKERDQVISERDHVIGDRDKVLREVTKEKDQVIRKRDQVIRERDQVINDRDHIISERDQLVREKGQIIKDRDQMTLVRKDLNETVVNLRQRLDDVMQENVLVEAKLKATNERNVTISDQFSKFDSDLKQSQERLDHVIQQRDHMMQLFDHISTVELSWLRNDLATVQDLFLRFKDSVLSGATRMYQKVVSQCQAQMDRLKSGYCDKETKVQ